MDKLRNLLAEWHNRALLHASPFHIVPRFSREKIEFVRDTLMLSFPSRYFQLKVGQEMSTNKINWIKSLLLVPDHLGSVKALYEIALVLKYAETLPSEFQGELKSLQVNPFNLRSFLFELSIYKALDQAGIPTIKKPYINGQPMEGFCELKGKQFLFECKQLYMPRLDELFVVQRLMRNLMELSDKKGPLNGYIISLKMDRPIGEKHLHYFREKIITFYKDLPHGVNAEINYRVAGELGELSATTFTHDALLEMKAEARTLLLLYVEPTGKVRSDGAILLEGKITGNFEISRDRIYKKLESVLKMEEDQHPRKQFPNKIIFLASESYQEFQFGIFQENTMFDQNRVIALANKLDLNSIICIIRKYFQRDNPSTEISVIAPPNLLDEANILRYVLEQQ